MRSRRQLLERATFSVQPSVVSLRLALSIDSPCHCTVSANLVTHRYPSTWRYAQCALRKQTGSQPRSYMSCWWQVICQWHSLVLQLHQ